MPLSLPQTWRLPQIPMGRDPKRHARRLKRRAEALQPFGAVSDKTRQDRPPKALLRQSREHKKAVSRSGDWLSDNHANEATLKAAKARQAQMQLYAFNLGALGAMAKGEVEYDADAATAAASNLAKLSSMNARALWPAGSDNESLGKEATAALPAIWAEGSQAGEKAKALVDASSAMEAAAGESLDALRGAIGAVGASCGGCHKMYRQSNS